MKKQQGISLLEIILVIVTIGILLTLTLRYFLLTNSELKVTRAMTQIERLAKASEQWLEAQRQADYAGSSPETAISFEKLEAAGLITANDAKSPWGGNMLVEPSSDDPVYIKITIRDIPLKSCYNLIERMQPVAHKQIMKKGCLNLKKYYVEL